MGAKWQSAPEVESIAKDVIRRYPGQFGHLQDREIRFIWREKHRKLRGRVIYGLAWIQGGLPSVMIRDALKTTDWSEAKDYKFFMMEIAMDLWQDLTSKQREALVAHELCHMGVDDEGGICTLPHDIEEFDFIARTYGPWRTDLENFADALIDHKQLTTVDEMILHGTVTPIVSEETLQTMRQLEAVS